MALDPFDVDFAFDEMPGTALHDVLRAHREQAPVTRTRFLGIPSFLVTGHEALTEAFRDTWRFPPHRMYQSSFEPAIGRSFISMEDPEQHLRYRKLATPAFRSRAISRYEREGMAALACELIDEFPSRDPVDLVEAFTSRFPYLVITRLLGLPREREEEFHGWALALLRFRDDPAQARQAGAELTRFLAPVVEARRAEPRDDVISGLVHAEVDGRHLEDEEIYAHVRLLFPTGGETTHGSLGNLLWALLTHRDAWEALRADPSRIPDAVEEGLRWETPIAVLPRMTRSEPTEFFGVEMPADSWVLFAMAAANRDPAVHREPDRFDINRPVDSLRRETLTFGRGVKSCPGMHLARKNMAVALQTLLERTPDLQLVDADKALPRRSVLRAPDALWVRRQRS